MDDAIPSKQNAHHFENIGKTFGRWFVESIHKNSSGIYHYFCTCDCGNTAYVQYAHLKSGASNSCGCYKAELVGKNHQRYKHGGYSVKSSKKLRRMAVILDNMVKRCHNENTPDYEYYGARGIRVCKRWRHSFENFLSDMGFPPTKHHTIDRINNDKGYKPSNCKWSTRKEQANNRRKFEGIRLRNKQGRFS